MGPRNLKKKNLLKRIEEAKKYFFTEKYKTCISLASMLLEQNKLTACEEVLTKLPTKDILLESLVSKLKGKSVYKTLKQIHENKNMNPLVKIKGLSSLITHCSIECQNGKKEYGVLFPPLLEKLNELISEL